MSSLMERIMAAKLAKAKPPKPVEFKASPVHPGKADMNAPRPSPLPFVRRPVDGVELVPNLRPPEFLGASRGSCKAINAETGRQCALLAGHTKPHRHGSTEFARVATPGQSAFSRRDALDALATRHDSSTPTGDL